VDYISIVRVTPLLPYGSYSIEARAARDLSSRRCLFSNSYLTALTAVLGTTISPYLFFWQASVEVAEQKAAAARESRLSFAPSQAPAQLERDARRHLSRDGIFQHHRRSSSSSTPPPSCTAHGITDIQTGAQAAEALRPLAGGVGIPALSAWVL